jgi:quinol monooxygenase YgiN
MFRSLFSFFSAAGACLVLLALAPYAYAADEPVVVIVKVYPSVGREDELQARYLKQAEFLRRVEPNASFRLHRSLKEPITFLWYETYPSQAALESHLKVAMPAFRKEFGPTPEGLVARPSDSDSYQELAKP